MKVSGQITLFVKEQKGEKGPFKTFSTTIGHKQDGVFINATMNVKFSKDLEEGLKQFKVNYCYTLDIKEGWLDCKPYTNKEGKQQREIYVFIAEAEVKSKKKIESNENELPNLSK